ncbi:hypothetical protein PoB_004670300 [Plakobranchus ocellatus]|uniref:Uncharacterized protein n=1 Tax=Plakobranchus ocellatus TaxID=259542 RepID=A0AAV4BKU7_9GAST|nr:hypothetical protein PoB_004670300 [Plakobranchus ocellatus]
MNLTTDVIVMCTVENDPGRLARSATLLSLFRQRRGFAFPSKAGDDDDDDDDDDDGDNDDGYRGSGGNGGGGRCDVMVMVMVAVFIV